MVGLTTALIGIGLTMGLKILASRDVLGPLGMMIAGSAGLAGYYGALVAREGIGPWI